MYQYKEGQEVIIVNNEILKGNTVGPTLTLGDVKKIKRIILDKNGNQHLDLGLKSRYMYIRSYETKEELPNGDSIHWVHPSRVTPL